MSDVFDAVDGTFDLMVIDPPFRWFVPRDLLEASCADEGYRALGRFMAGAAERLDPGGRILRFFGSSGDVEHVESLIDHHGFARERLASRDLTRGGTHGQLLDRPSHPVGRDARTPPRRRRPTRPA